MAARMLSSGDRGATGSTRGESANGASGTAESLVGPSQPADLVLRKSRVRLGVATSLLGQLPESAFDARGQSLALQAVMRPSNLALVDRIDAARKELAALFCSDTQLIREFGLRLRGGDSLPMDRE